MRALQVTCSQKAVFAKSLFSGKKTTHFDTSRVHLATETETKRKEGQKMRPEGGGQRAWVASRAGEGGRKGPKSAKHENKRLTTRIG